MNRPLVRWVLVLIVPLTLDCGSSSHSSTGTSSGGTGGLPYAGEIELVGGTGGSFEILANFTPTPTSFDYFSIAQKILDPCAGGPLVGSCCYRGLGGQGTSGGLPPTAESAGTLTVEDGSSQLGTLTFSGGYVGLFTGISWNSGDTVLVSASGATVDAFTGSVRIPGAVMGVTPELSTVSPPSVSLSSNLLISWTPDSAAGEQMSIILTDGTNGHIFCNTADVSGSVSVSTSLLSNFSSGDTADIGIARIASANPADANASVILIAQLAGGAGQLALQ